MKNMVAMIMLLTLAAMVASGADDLRPQTQYFLRRSRASPQREK